MRAIFLAVAIAAAGCAGSPVPELVSNRVHVERGADGWSAELVMDRDAPVWGFVHSSRMRDGMPQWRPLQWQVMTPGVTLDRLGAWDVLRSVDGGPVPRKVLIRMTPASARVAAAYNPALVFSDGSVALFSDQFDMFPATSAEVVRAMPDDLNGMDIDMSPPVVTWSDVAGPVLFRGKLRDDPSASGGETYVLFGKARLAEYDSLAAVVDPAMPQWIQSAIIDFAPRVTAYYAGRLGGGPDQRPTIMASWNGPTPGMTSMGGSVLPGLIAMSFEGADVIEETDDLRSMVHWFIGHEGAHFWLGQIVRYEFARDAWITEGGSDMTAIRGLAALDPGYDAKGDMQARVDQCIALLGGGSIVDAASRGDHQSHYACGAVFAMVAELVQMRRDGGDWFDFLRNLIVENRADGVLTRKEWLAKLAALSGDAVLVEGIEQMLDHGAAEPADAIAALFTRAGVSHRREGGKVVLL